jgi:hypothetical protein
MRYIVIVLISLFSFGACVTTNIESEGGFTSFGIDFRPYTNEGFLITTEKPNGDYKAMGLIRVDQSPKIIKTTESQYSLDKRDGFKLVVTSVGTNPEYYLVEEIEIQKSIDELYRISKEWGANALFNLEIIRSEHPDLSSADIITVSGLAVLIEK